MELKEEMFESPTLEKIVPALIEAQLIMEKIEKDGEVNINGRPKRKYATLQSVFGAIKPSLLKNGIFFSQPLVEIGDKLYLYTILRHTSGEYLKSKFEIIRAENFSMQDLGSQITYARRYTAISILGVVADEDDDGESLVKNSISETAQEQNQGPKSEYISQKQVGLFMAKTSKYPELRDTIFKNYNVTSADKFKWKDFNRVLETITFAVEQLEK